MGIGLCLNILCHAPSIFAFLDLTWVSVTSLLPSRLFASCKLDNCPILKPKLHKINHILDAKANKSGNRVDRRAGNQENRVPVTRIAGNQEAKSVGTSNKE